MSRAGKQERAVSLRRFTTIFPAGLEQVQKPTVEQGNPPLLRKVSRQLLSALEVTGLQTTGLDLCRTMGEVILGELEVVAAHSLLLGVVVSSMGRDKPSRNGDAGQRCGALHGRVCGSNLIYVSG